MEIFLVGGAVRDFLLAKINNEFKSQLDEKNYWSNVEKDWVVVGATSRHLLSLGYRQVGKSFPVFLHPDTQEEYALARTERKIGKGYTGFECNAAENVTLEEDLKRRDLTINAIAMRVIRDDFSQYEIIDPYHGLQDLKDKVFRHISQAFAEDPVRILRIARLASRFGNFHIAASTEQLMEKMVIEGEVDALVPERVWQEWSRSLKEKNPWRFFEILESCLALKKLFPTINNLSFKKEALTQAVKEAASEEIILAIQLFDLKNTELSQLIKTYHIPNNFSGLALIVTKFYPDYLTLNWQSSIILKLLEQTDAFRRQKRFVQFLEACEYLGIQKQKSEKLKQILNVLVTIDNTKLVEQGFSGAEFAAEVKKLRLNKITEILA